MNDDKDRKLMAEAREKARSIKITAVRPPEELAHIDLIRERSYVRHVLARHIETNDYARIRDLRRKHGM